MVEQKRILNSSYKHQFNWSRPTSNYGKKKIKVRIPSGWKFYKCGIKDKKSSGVGTSVRVTKRPPKDSRGDREIEIGWKVGPNGRLSYGVEAFAYKPAKPRPRPRPRVSPVTINLESRNWQKKAINAIMGKKPVNIKINPKTKAGKELIRIMGQLIKQGKLKMKIHRSVIAIVVGGTLISIPAWVVVVAILAASTVAIIAILAAVLMLAIKYRCEIPKFVFETDYGTGTPDSRVALTAKNTTKIALAISGCRGP